MCILSAAIDRVTYRPMCEIYDCIIMRDKLVFWSKNWLNKISKQEELRHISLFVDFFLLFILRFVCSRCVDALAGIGYDRFVGEQRFVLAAVSNAVAEIY